MKKVNIEYEIDELVYFMYRNRIVSGIVRNININSNLEVKYDIFVESASGDNFQKDVEILSNTLQGLFEKLEIDFKK